MMDKNSKDGEGTQAIDAGNPAIDRCIGGNPLAGASSLCLELSSHLFRAPMAGKPDAYVNRGLDLWHNH